MSKLTFEEKFNGIFSAIVLLSVLSVGIGGIHNYYVYHNKITSQKEITKKQKYMAPLSRLEITYEKGLAKEVLKLSTLGNSTKFELDEKGLARTITEISSPLFGKVKIKRSSPTAYATHDRERINEDVKNCLKYLKKEE